MPRARRRSDDVYNARRRFRRQAERFIKKASTATGIQKARFEQQARNAIMDAMATYQKLEPKGAVARVANQLGVTRGTMVARGYFSRSFNPSPVRPVPTFTPIKDYKQDTVGGITYQQRQQLMAKSLTALEGVGESRDDMARDLLKGNVGHRFYAGLSEIWASSPEGRKDPEGTIVRHFGANSIMDVVEELEASGIDFYTPEDEAAAYTQVALQVMLYASKRGK